MRLNANKIPSSRNVTTSRWNLAPSMSTVANTIKTTAKTTTALVTLIAMVAILLQRARVSLKVKERPKGKFALLAATQLVGNTNAHQRGKAHFHMIKAKVRANPQSWAIHYFGEAKGEGTFFTNRSTTSTGTMGPRSHHTASLH